MDNIQPITYENIIKVIRAWPLSQRLMLVQDILRTLVPELKIRNLNPKRPKQTTLQQALGLLSTNQPAPIDSEVQEWLDEHRLEKYS